MAWSLTNSGNAAASNAASVAISAFANPLSNPSILVAMVQFTGPQTLTSVTDTAGNTYVDCGLGALQMTANVNGQFLQLLVANNTHTTSSNIVTANISATTNFPRICVGEWTGGATSSPIDVKNSVVNQSSAGGANACSITATTTNNNGELIVAGWATINFNITAGTSPNAFTLVGTPTGGNALEYFVQTTAASISPTAGTTGSDTYAGIMVALKTPAGSVVLEDDSFKILTMTQAEPNISVW